MPELALERRSLAVERSVAELVMVLTTDFEMLRLSGMGFGRRLPIAEVSSDGIDYHSLGRPVDLSQL